MIENKNLINELDTQLDNKLDYNQESRTIQSINSIKGARKLINSNRQFINSLEDNNAISLHIQSILNNQKLLASRENEISCLNELVNELEESYLQLECKFKELELKVKRKGKNEHEEIVRKDVQNVLNSMIEKVEINITQEDYDEAINKLNQAQVSFDFAIITTCYVVHR